MILPGAVTMTDGRGKDDAVCERRKTVTTLDSEPMLYAPKTFSKCFPSRMAIAFALVGVTWSGVVHAQSRPQALDYLHQIGGNKTLAGQHNREPNAEPDKWTKWISTTVGKTPAMWSGDFLFGPKDIANRRAMMEEARRQWEKGAVVSLLWHACSPASAEPCKWKGGVQAKLSDEQWEDLFDETSEIHKTFKKRLDDLAEHLRYLKGHDVEVLFRPFHEMNQGAFWWGGRKGPDGTAKLYRMTHHYMTETKGLDNLIWVYDLQDFRTLPSDLNDYDPGEQYWDVLALDVYRTNGVGYSTKKYEAVVQKAGAKPIAIGECDILPTPEELAAQPRWTFFMGWAERVREKNAESAIRAVYESDRVLTLDEMPGWMQK